MAVAHIDGGFQLLEAVGQRRSAGPGRQLASWINQTGLQINLRRRPVHRGQANSWPMLDRSERIRIGSDSRAEPERASRCDGRRPPYPSRATRRFR
jgi:hypothetical protein